MSSEAQETLENQLKEYGHTSQFYVSIEFKDDVGTIHTRRYSVSDFNTLSKILYTQKQGMCPYLKKALEDWKSRKEQANKTSGQNIQKATNLSYEIIPMGALQPPCEFCDPKDVQPSSWYLLANKKKTPVCGACKDKLDHGEIQFMTMESLWRTLRLAESMEKTMRIAEAEKAFCSIKLSIY